MTTIETRLSELRTAVETLNDTITNGGKVEEARGAVTKAVNAINGVLIADRVAVLRAMPTEEMWAEYIDHQFIPGYSAKKDKDTGLYGIVAPDAEEHDNVRVTFFALNNDAEHNLARLPQWNTMFKVLCENLALSVSKGMGHQFIAFNGDNGKLVAERKKMGEKWQPKEGSGDPFTKRDLEEMLSEVVYAIGVPTDLIKRMIYADVEFLKLGLATAKKRKDDTTGSIVQSSNLTMEDHLFTTIYHRKNKVAYEWQRAKDSVAEVKETNTTLHPEQEGMPAEYTEQPEASEVVTTTAPAEVTAE